jgi:hypothetical protein
MEKQKVKGSNKGRAVVSHAPILLSEDGQITESAERKAKDVQNHLNKKENEDVIFNLSDQLKSSSLTPKLSVEVGTELEPKLSMSTELSPNLLSSSSRSLDFKRTFVEGEFFGGAIVCQIPTSFEDVSNLRQVPDHQEVYMDKDSEMSFIIELLAFEDTVSHADAAQYFFDDLASCNEAVEKSVEYNDKINDPDVLTGVEDCVKYCLKGRQTVTKLNQERGTTADVVQTHLFIVRLPKVTTDMLISLNYPAFQVETESDKVTPAVTAEQTSSTVDEIMGTIQRSLKIVDWSLFA